VTHSQGADTSERKIIARLSGTGSREPGWQRHGLYGADVLNIWRPRDSEIEAFFWDVQVGMRSTILDDAKKIEKIQSASKGC